MKKTILTSVVALITCAASAFAADLNGNIEAGVRYNDVIGNKGKANEYRDPSQQQGIVNFGLGLSVKDYYLDLDAKSGFSADSSSKQQERTDQSYRLKGGQYESFKYSLFFDEIPHNITSGAQTLYPGAGSGLLIAPVLASVGAPSTAATAAAVAATKAQVAALKAAELAAPKTTVNYSLLRKNYGAGFEVSLKTPFFVSARVERNETNGILPLGTYLGQEKEIPQPIDFLTDNLYLETGYRSKGLIFTVDGMLSSFHEQTPSMLLAFTNANGTLQSQGISLPPSNEYYKVGGNLKYDMPFIKSTLMARGSYSKATSQMNLFDRVTAATTGAATAIAGSGTLFNGDIHYTTAAAALTSNPTKNLDTRLFMNFLNKQNESTEGINFTAGAGTNLTEGFSYHKINGGLDIGYKLPAKTKLSAGYEYLNVVRGIRDDATKTTDHIGYVQVKNTLFDWMSARVRAQHLMREGKFTTLFDAANAGTGYIRPFDAATKTQDKVNAVFEFEPLHNLSLGLEYAYKIDQFHDSMMGIQHAASHDVNLDATVVAGIFKFNPYVDLEFSKETSKHRVGNNVITTTSPTQYNWLNNAENVYYALGMNSEVALIKDTLFANIGVRYENSDGTERFATDQSAVDPNNPIVNNNSVENFIRKSITGRLTAKFTKQLKGTVSYTYEKLQFLDDHYLGYNNFDLAEAGAGYALTGAFNNPDYTAHIAYVSLAYSF